MKATLCFISVFWIVFALADSEMADYYITIAEEALSADNLISARENIELARQEHPTNKKVIELAKIITKKATKIAKDKAKKQEDQKRKKEDAQKSLEKKNAYMKTPEYAEKRYCACGDLKDFFSEKLNHDLAAIKQLGVASERQKNQLHQNQQGIEDISKAQRILKLKHNINPRCIKKNIFYMAAPQKQSDMLLELSGVCDYFNIASSTQ